MGRGGSLNFENLGEGVLKPLLKFRWKRESKNHAFRWGGGGVGSGFFLE